MSFQTPQGKAYTLDDLLRIASLGTFRDYTGAITGALHQLKATLDENARLKEENLRLQGIQLSHDYHNGKNN